MRKALIGSATALVVAAMTTQAAMASGLRLASGGASGSSRDNFRIQTRVMDTRLARQYSASSGEAVVPVVAYSGSRRSEFLPSARAAAERHGVPVDLFFRLVNQESRWNPGAVSTAGARGLAQLMPGTAAQLGVNPDDPHQNLDGGARYLRMMYDQFGDWRLALAAYNAGPGAVERHNGVPPFEETTHYVRVVMGAG
ncbi:lytic transglycosylase domain-containing protein [Pararhodobacter sp.]|uniref:lytic transglycosylase domain-containing protein n=1 Tax=Pararhodobacter sp. TaxID=2127056 RepID=UPI002AFF42E1|nr:lytic transglycosylase domain-containing protein [Pararhodobacter sp.]